MERNLLNRLDSELYDEMLKKRKEEEFVIWNKLFSILSQKYRISSTGEMVLDREETYNELSKEFELKFKK